MPRTSDSVETTLDVNLAPNALRCVISANLREVVSVCADRWTGRRARGGQAGGHVSVRAL